MRRSSPSPTVVIATPPRLFDGLQKALAALGRDHDPQAEITRLAQPLDALIHRAHAVAPARGMVIVAEGEQEAGVALTLGADEVLLAPIEPATLSRALKRAKMRAAAREDRAFEARTLAQILAGLADSIDAPLTALALDLDALRSSAEATSSDDVPALVDCAKAAERITERVRDLHLLAPSPSGHAGSEAIALPTLVDQVLRILGGAIALRAHIERDDDESLAEVFAPRRLLARTIAHVLVHALDDVDLSEDRQRLRKLRIALRPDIDATAIVIEARPDLEVPPESAPIALEDTGRLSVAREIARSFEGELVAERASDGGVRYVLFVPRAQRGLSPSVGLRPFGAPVARPRRPRVLVVDHDERVLRATARALAERYDAVLAIGGEEALALVEERAVDVAVIDLGLVDITPALLVDELHRRRPELAGRCLVVAREPRDPRIPPRTRVLVRPLRRDALLSAVDELLAADELPRAPLRSLRDLN